MINIDIYWVCVQINTTNTDLADFIKKYYRIFLVEKNNLEPKIIITINKYWYFDSIKHEIKKSTKMTTVGDYINIDFKDSIYTFVDREISGIIKFAEDWKIYVDWYLKPRRIHHIVNLCLQWIDRVSKYYNRFIIKTLIHDPIFIVLEKLLKINILHATAVTNWKKTFVFTGLGGSWKSTLAGAFFAKKWYQILSDNYCMISDGTLYPFPELPRVTNQTVDLLGIKRGKKADWIKTYLDNRLEKVNKSYPIDKIFICTYGDWLEIIELNDKDQVFELLLWINNYTKEFPEYLNFALLPLIWQYMTWKQRLKSLDRLVDNNKFYLLKNSADLNLNLDIIENV